MVITHTGFKLYILCTVRKPKSEWQDETSLPELINIYWVVLQSLGFLPPNKQGLPSGYD